MRPWVLSQEGRGRYLGTTVNFKNCEEEKRLRTKD
ncbi:MAG: hypothetical protein E8D45_06935 [Nitrospira sp.]|nr:MAG: hypothetical protein E8D45_06935 [Nitrospira sp.]